MRTKFCEAMRNRAKETRTIFLTGDLGFSALEPLRDIMGPRFINAGVAEQNMISVAAAMVREQYEVWVYSIAAFAVARPFEQIRNDIAFHKLPVKLVGNGGGYSYGVMGPSHHAVEDYGILLTLPHIAVFIPVFDNDLSEVVANLGNLRIPAYLRLGHDEHSKNYSVPKYAAWRQLVEGDGMTAIVVGPLASSYLNSCMRLPRSLRPNLWALSELPLDRNEIPELLLRQISSGPGLCIAEEHVEQGSFGSIFALHLLKSGIFPKRFSHLYARSQIYPRYGSQKYLREQSNLSPDAFLAEVIAH